MLLNCVWRLRTLQISQDVGEGDLDFMSSLQGTEAVTLGPIFSHCPWEAESPARETAERFNPLSWVELYGYLNLGQLLDGFLFHCFGVLFFGKENVLG